VTTLVEAKPTLNTVTLVFGIAPTNAVVAIGVFPAAQ
jgi:hypothetical protein